MGKSEQRFRRIFGPVHRDRNIPYREARDRPFKYITDGSILKPHQMWMGAIVAKDISVADVIRQSFAPDLPALIAADLPTI